MPLAEDKINRLKGLLKECTALVVVDGKPKGSAFFIREDLLLTCEHVIHAAGSITIQPFQAAAAPVPVLLPVAPSVGGDVALLQVSSEHVVATQPCVVLGSALTDGTFSIAGYPREDGQLPGMEVNDLLGRPRQDAQSGVAQLLQLDPGKIVTFGNSGGPVLSHQTGAVVALMRTSRDPGDALGGGAVPVHVAASAFSDVATLLARPSMAVRRWRDILGRDAWAALDKVWDLEARVTVRVSGDASAWRISLDAPVGLERDMLGPDLGADIGEALFRWAQRQRIREDDEVEVLGRLLAAALFPQPLSDQLSRLRGADKLTLRLWIESGSDLADIPWELAAVPGQNRFLAADDEYRFVRVFDGAEVAPPAASEDVVRVVATVALPTTWEYPVVYGDNRYDFPSAADLAHRLVNAVEGGHGGFLRSHPQVNPRPGDLRAVLEDESLHPTVLHFMGIGRTYRNSRLQIALGNERDAGDGYSPVRPKWESLEKVLVAAAEAGIIVAVLEFLLPPVDSNDDPITLKGLTEIIPAEFLAVVTTRFPVHPLQAQQFNDTFYEQLRLGESVETAVQIARCDLAQNKPIEDSSGFGWFTVVTRTRDDLRLLARRTNEPSPTSGRLVRGISRDRPAKPDQGASDVYG